MTKKAPKKKPGRVARRPERPAKNKLLTDTTASGSAGSNPAPPHSDLLKIPVRLTKLSSKVGRDTEIMWMLQLEAPNSHSAYIQTLVPFIEHSFVMFLVKVDDVKQAKEALEGDVELGDL